MVFKRRVRKSNAIKVKGKYGYTKVVPYRKVAATVAKVQRYLKPEFKYMDYNSTWATILNTNVNTWNLVPWKCATGDTMQTRTGNKINILSLDAKFYVTMNATATGTILRILIYYYKESDLDSAAMPTAADMIESPYFQGQFDIDYGKRLKVIYQKYVVMDDSLTTTKFIRIRLRGLKIPSYYTGANNTDFGRNQLVLFMTSNEAVNGPTVQINSRARFIDE